MNQMPNKVKVGAVDYTIVIADLQENDYGCCDTHMQVITLSPNQTVQSASDTLLHEILHAIWNESGLFIMKRPDEETIVRLMATWLKTVMIDNPDISKFVQDASAYWPHNATPTGDKKARRHV